VGAGFVACSATNASRDKNTDSRDKDNDSDEGGGSPTSGAGGQGGSLLGGDGGTTGCAPGELTCSSNLHDVTLCDGQVVQTCPPDQGCANGACVAACDAARINKSTIGCDYFTVNPDVTFSAGACFAAFVANTWTTPVNITVERNGVPLDASSFAASPRATARASPARPCPTASCRPARSPSSSSPSSATRSPTRPRARRASSRR